MNDLNLKILYELDDDARSNLSNIAKKTRTSQQMISYTVKQFIKKKIIRDFTTVFDYSRFDLNSYIVMFRLFYKSKKDFNNFLHYLKSAPELSKLEVLDGKWDVYAVFLVPNPSYFNKMLHKIKSDNINLVRDDLIITTVVTYLFPRTYLRSGKHDLRKFMIVGGDRNFVKLTDNQKEICKQLLLSPLAKISDLSKKTSMSFLTITNAIKNLKSRNVIRGFKPIIDYEQTSVICKKVFIKYQGVLLDEDGIISFCKEYVNVINIVKTFGKWDLIITVEALKKKDFNNFLTSLREQFEDYMADFEVMDVQKTEVLNFLPKNYFSD